MQWTSMPPRKLKKHLYHVMGKKAGIVFYVINKMTNHPGWTQLNIHKIEQQTKMPAKKIYKTLKMLKKRDIIQYRHKKMQVRPTKSFAVKANAGYRQYLDKHPHVKAKIIKTQRRLSKKHHRKHHLLQKIRKRF